MQGTPLATVTTFDAREEPGADRRRKASRPSGGGIERHARPQDDEEGRQKPRATIFSGTTETLEIATTVPPSDLEIPAGFKQSK